MPIECNDCRDEMLKRPTRIYDARVDHKRRGIDKTKTTTTIFGENDDRDEIEKNNSLASTRRQTRSRIDFFLKIGGGKTFTGSRIKKR